MSELLLENYNMNQYSKTSIDNLISLDENGNILNESIVDKIATVSKAIIELIKKIIGLVGKLIKHLDNRRFKLDKYHKRITTWWTRVKNERITGNISITIEIYNYVKLDTKMVTKTYFNNINKFIKEMNSHDDKDYYSSSFISEKFYPKIRDEIDKYIYGKPRDEVSKKKSTFKLVRDYENLAKQSNVDVLVEQKKLNQSLANSINKYNQKIKKYERGSSDDDYKELLRIQSIINCLNSFRNNYNTDIERMIADSIKISNALIAKYNESNSSPSNDKTNSDDSEFKFDDE